MERPVMLNLEISGYASDSIEIRSIKIPGGKIQEKLQLDHYYRDIAIKFSPYKAKEGNIKIKYSL